jgi:streptogramin lyase
MPISIPSIPSIVGLGNPEIPETVNNNLIVTYDISMYVIKNKSVTYSLPQPSGSWNIILGSEGSLDISKNTITFDGSNNNYTPTKEIWVGGNSRIQGSHNNGSIIKLHVMYTSPTPILYANNFFNVPDYDNVVGAGVDKITGKVYVAGDVSNVIYKISKDRVNLGTLQLDPSTNPTGVCVDICGNIYVADHGNSAVSKIDINNNNTISYYAGIPGSSGYSGDASYAITAKLNRPEAVAVDLSKNLYIADTANNKIRKVSSTNNTITTIVSTRLKNPEGVSVDKNGNIYIADTKNHSIRKFNGSTLTLFAGTDVSGNSEDGIIATTSKLYNPTGVCVDLCGNVYIADTGNQCIRMVDTNGIIRVISGIPGKINTISSNLDNDVPTNFALDSPTDIIVDNSGNLYIVNSGTSQIISLTPTRKNNNNVVCFARGTLIYTESGYKPVELLKAGDMIYTKGRIYKNERLGHNCKSMNLVSSDRKSSSMGFEKNQIQWISSFSVANPNVKSFPICFKRGSMGENVPATDLFLSPEHSVCHKNRMIPAKDMVNDDTIFQDTSADSIEYYHIEMPHHCALLSNGLLTESYIDSGNRGMFRPAPRLANKSLVRKIRK